MRNKTLYGIGILVTGIAKVQCVQSIQQHSRSMDVYCDYAHR